MTALAGLWCRNGRPGAAAMCRDMLDAQVMSPADHAAQWAGGEVALGRRLVRRLPEDRFDRGPVLGGDGRFALVADLRLDNRDELAEGLGLAASRAREMSDAGLLMSAWERWQQGCLDRLLGDYAFALWDSEKRQLWLVRDPLGQRPLHYFEDDRLVAFATLARGVHALAEVPPAVDEARLAHFLALRPGLGSHSFFAGVRRVEPGGLVEISSSSARRSRHWQPRPRSLAPAEARDCPAALREQIDTAIRRRLRGASQVGAHLSGGLDSGGVAASAALILSGAGRRLFAFTAVPGGNVDLGPDGRVFDEGPRAASVAALHPNIDHVRVTADGRSMLDDLEQTLSLTERPPLDLFNVGWLHEVLDAARARGVDVLLTGDFGNLSWSHEGLEHLAELVRQGRLGRWFATSRSLASAGGISWSRLLVRSFAPFAPPFLYDRLSSRRLPGLVRDAAAGIMTASGRAALEASSDENAAVSTPRLWRDGHALRLWGLARLDPGMQVKAALAGWGIDKRDPTADVRLVEFCLAVPGGEFLRGGRTRALARNALAGRMPESLLDSNRRGLQAADWPSRLDRSRDELLRALARFESCEPVQRLIDWPRLRTLLAAWSGDEADLAAIITYRSALFRAIGAGAFARWVAGGTQAALGKAPAVPPPVDVAAPPMPA